MLSKKMAFSLTSLITILALAFVVSPAMGVVLGDGFETKLSLKHQARPDGGTTTPYVIADNVLEGGGPVNIKVVFTKRIASLLTGDDLTNADGTEDTFTLHDITVTAKDQSDRNYDADSTTDGTQLVMPATIAVFSTLADSPVASTNMKEFQFTLGTITPTVLSPDGTGTGAITVEVKVLADRVKNDDVADRIKAIQNSGDSLGYNAEGVLKFTIVPEDTNRPTATISDVPAIVLGPTSDPSFSIKVTLSEKPAGFGKDHIDVKNATVDAVVKVTDTVYTVVIKPKYETKDDIAIRIKPFERNKFPRTKSVLTAATKVKVNSDANRRTTYGTAKNLTNKAVVPMDGYLVVAKDEAMSLIVDPGNHEHKAADIARRVEAKLRTYNLVAVDLGINLEGFFLRGGTIDLISPDAGLVISEIMWATDGGRRDRQWIEIMNASGAEVVLGDGTHKLMFYEANEVLPDMTDAANKIVDRVSTLYKGTNHWSIAGKGQSGRSNAIVQIPGQDFEVVATDRLISMERAMAADGTYGDGTMAGSWASSMPPSQNFMDTAGGLFVGSPGTSAINPVADVVVTLEPEPTPADVAMKDDIKITEIMVDTGSGRLPQWIELTNVAGKEVSLAGWSVEIENTAADADVIGTSISISLSGTLGIGGGEGAGGTMGKSHLLVAGSARSSSNLSGSDRVVDVSAAVDQKGRYTLLSPMGFLITLLPPQTTGIVQYGDMAGNLDASPAWDIPMGEDGRSSLIRHEMAAGMMTKGTEASGWVLASSTSLVSGPATWYGSDEDAGTPGYDSGGPLPVELSHFRPARDKATGAVVITWATQSELNNAGFFIKRSNQRDGEFKVINATMIAGAGTTSEKQFYTYTDTTAQPNVVYYYQIEDVSLDGNRQTLTRGIRLKGHIGAAGKLTSTWGEIKASNE
ncbi:MAG: Ig-like domain-containing protein [Candidatus Poribacteria bacterium]|nr:Ig-like domain-containing protein [Candidatus Poribacteria bacterium]